MVLLAAMSEAHNLIWCSCCIANTEPLICVTIGRAEVEVVWNVKSHSKQAPAPRFPSNDSQTGPSAAVMQRMNKCTHVAHASAENRPIPVLQHQYGCSEEKGKEQETEWLQNHPLFSNYQHFFKKMTHIGEVDGKWPLWKRQCTGRQQPRAIWERAARDVNTFCSVKWPITVKPFGLPCCGGDGTEHSTAIHIFLRPETPAALLLKIMNTHTYSVEYESFFPKLK